VKPAAGAVASAHGDDLGPDQSVAELRAVRAVVHLHQIHPRQQSGKVERIDVLTSRHPGHAASARQPIGEAGAMGLMPQPPFQRIHQDRAHRVPQRSQALNMRV
jgi:hypothetical protein